MASQCVKKTRFFCGVDTQSTQWSDCEFFEAGDKGICKHFNCVACLNPMAKDLYAREEFPE